MQHPDEGTIHAWLDGALSADEAARVDAHVKDCPQCQAAVAEARGFIAASSRILTALDDAPRGVIPVAAPRKGVQPWVWRVAATVLVVATGTFVVLREGGGKSVSGRIPTTLTSAQSADKTASDSVSSAEVASPAMAPAAGASPTTAPAAPPAIEFRAMSRQTAPANEPVMTAQSRGGTRSLSRKSAPAPAPARVDAAQDFSKSGEMLSARVPAVQSAGFGSTSNSALALRQVSQKRTIGKVETYYELTPGDTVVLEEQVAAQLSGIVVTGATAGRTSGDRRAQPQAMAATGNNTANTAGANAPVAQRAEAPTAAKVEAPAPPPSVAALQDAAAVGGTEIHRISWLDRSSGRVVILSGRHSQEELEQIRRRIDQLRAAESSKKNPE